MLIGLITYLMLGSLLPIFTNNMIKKELSGAIDIWYKEYTEFQRKEKQPVMSYLGFKKYVHIGTFCVVTLFWPYFVYRFFKGMFKK